MMDRFLLLYSFILMLYLSISIGEYRASRISYQIILMSYTYSANEKWATNKNTKIIVLETKPSRFSYPTKCN